MFYSIKLKDTNEIYSLYINTLEERRQRTLNIMQMPASKGGLGWTYEKAIQWEENIYNGLRGENYELIVKAFLNNCYTVMELETQGICF